MVRTLIATLNDGEYDELEQLKKKDGLTWRELILTLIRPKG